MPTLKKDLEYFGDGLQYRFVKSLIESPSIFVEVEHYLNPDLFNDPGLVSIIRVMKDFYRTKGRTASYRDLEYHLKDLAKTQDSLDETYTAFKKIKDEESLFDGLETAKEIGLEYIKKKEMLHQLDNAKNSVRESGYSPERLTRIVEGLQGIENRGDIECIIPGCMFDEVMDEAKSERVPSGIDILDKQMNGGLGKSTTGLLIAGTGVGKTTLFSIMACGSAIKGNKVLYIFFEDKDTDFCRKFYSCITGLPGDYFHVDSPYKKEAEEAVKEKLKERPDIRDAFFNNVRAVRMPNSETTVEMVKTKIRTLIVSGWRPDVVFLDYIQCMKSSTDNKMSVDKEYATLDRCMKRLDSFAQEEHFALWVAQQTNRDGAKKESNDRIGNIQGSFRLCQTASAILYLERNHDESMDYTRINLYLDKCRGASLAAWKNAIMDNGTCQIDLKVADSQGEPAFYEEEPEVEINNKEY